MGRILGIDYGTKKIGLALTDEIRLFASPHDTFPNNEHLWNSLDELIKYYKVDAFVVGVPLHDKENSFEPQVLGFIRKLQRLYNFPIYTQDESLTSRDSRKFLMQTGKKGKKLQENLDKFAAQAILTSFLQQYERGRVQIFKENE